MFIVYKHFYNENTVKNFYKKLLFFVLVTAIASQFFSCKTVQRVPPSNLGYFKADSVYTSNNIQTTEPYVTKIQSDDILAVIVSSLNKESNEILNFTNVNTLPMSVFSGNVGGGSQPLGYPVDSSGSVNLPLIGKIRVAGLTLPKAEEKIKEELEKSIKSPVVNVRFMNHKFSVLGEVGTGGTYNLLDDRTTILDAIALAGDLTIFGNRDSIMVIRNANGRREIGLVNLQNRSVFTSPYFYLRNGDIIYVEPIPNKVVPEIPFQQNPPLKTNAFVQRLPLITSLISIVNLFVILFRR